MKKKLLAYAVLPALALTLVGVGTASAHGFGFGGIFGKSATPEEIATRQQEMFSQQAAMLGVSADVIKQSWADGKTLQEIAAANGISEADLQAKMKDAARQKMTEHMQALVSGGVVTQAQADARLKFMQSQMDSGKMGRHKGGMGMGMRF